MRFFYLYEIAPDSLIESNKFFSFSMVPNFLRVQTDHSLIHYILFKYTKDDDEFCEMIELEEGKMRDYTYGYQIKKWIINPYTINEEEITPKATLVRIFSNRDRISILFGKDDKKDEELKDSDFTLRYKKNESSGTWDNHIDDSKNCVLTGIWNKFDDDIEVITEGNVSNLSDKQFMYGDGNTDNNSGQVYGNGTVKTNWGAVYGNGDVTVNNRKNVYGNGFVERNSERVYGNGQVKWNDAYLNGSGYTRFNNHNNVYGNGYVYCNYQGCYVYGNGDVLSNINGFRVFGNGRVYKNGNWVDNDVTGAYYGNGMTWGSKESEISGQTLNSGIIKTNTDQEIKGNEITGNGNTVNCSVIYASNKKVIGNTIKGDSNTINGFRVYGTGNTIEGNTITGNKNIINPNYIDSNATGTTVNKSEVYGNQNVINDPDSVVVIRGTMNIFNNKNENN